MSGAGGSGAAPGPVVVPADTLRAFGRAVFAAKGMSAEHAGLVADALVWANLRGMDTHGVSRIPRYLELIECDDMNPQPVLRMVTETPASVVLDCDRAPGPVAMTAAVAHAIAKARHAGVGAAFARVTTHTAALGYFASQVAEQGMLAIAFSGSWPNMAYHGARAAGVSTSPVTFAVPGGAAGTLLLDMATGVTSVGKLRQAMRTGQPIAPGSALDRQGNPTTDPKAADIPLPLGGPKGAGLALMIEMLTGVLVGNGILADHMQGVPGGRRHRQNGVMIAFDIARFGDPGMFRQEVDRLVAALKALPRDPEVPEILMPGERGARSFAKRSREGVPIPRRILDEVNAAASRIGVERIG